jgi:hypothetical protein
VWSDIDDSGGVTPSGAGLSRCADRSCEAEPNLETVSRPECWPHEVDPGPRGRGRAVGRLGARSGRRSATPAAHPRLGRFRHHYGSGQCRHRRDRRRRSVRRYQCSLYQGLCRIRAVQRYDAGTQTSSMSYAEAASRRVADRCALFEFHRHPDNPGHHRRGESAASP